MSIMESVMHWIMPGRHASRALHERARAALASTEDAGDVVRKIVEASHAETAEAVELSDKTRERLVKLEARQKRRKDPHVSVVIETMKIMERRS
ncbi:hypothetical protein [Methylobacterium sp. WL19]|uniref:hypothetical protein n=1 Tax=Methylobacterium sp. WL19 TaxID=2603896 RepID=UPI0011C8B545|nr:hypothetical protein [Methylobacterium sp. WL19]TXN33873.1 hypothetical protein FV220_00020 [Methylobacterium sp. WL19]